MFARRRYVGLFVLLLLVSVAYLVWHGSREGRVAPRAGPSREKLPAQDSESAEAPSPADSVAQEGEEESGIRVSGRVSLADGSPGTIGSVFAVGEVEGRRRLLSARTETERGAFEIALAFEGASSPWSIDVSLRTVGFVRRQRTIRVVPGGEYTVDFVLDRGSALAGLILDSAGNPVRGLHVLARSMQTPHWGLVSDHLIAYRRLIVGDGEETVHFAHGSTDESGRFELKGLPDGTFGLFSMSEEWILVQDGLLRPPDRTVRVLALPALSLIGTVTDARTGQPLPRARAVLFVRLPEDRGSTKVVSVFDGKLRMIWKPAVEEEQEPFEVELRISADGYREGRATIPYPRGRRTGRVQIGLEPIAAPEMGTTIVQVVDAWGRPVDLPVHFLLIAVGQPDARPEAFRAEPEGPGTYRLIAPEGRWNLRVWPRQHLGTEIEWRGELQSWSGREGALRCALPPFGTLHIRRTNFPEGSEAWVVDVESADGSSGMMSLVETRGIRFAVEPGDWKVGVGGLPEAERRTVTVRPGEEMVVEIE